MKNRAVKIFMYVLVALVAVSGIAAVAMDRLGGREVPANGKPAGEEQSTTEEPTAEPPKTAAVRMLSVGDNLIHNGIYEQAQRRAGGKGYDFRYAYENVAADIAAADIATINQETPIAASYGPSSYPCFNSPKELGDEIVRIGFDVIAMANNHMLDKTSKGMRESIQYWKSKAPYVVKTGAYLDEAELQKVEYIERNGIKIGLVSCTEGTNGLSLPADSELRYIRTADEETLKAKIQRAKANCDAVLVNVHWGNEYTVTPTSVQRDLAKKMADWGADVIIGHHPHVIQPVEYIERADGGKTLVAFSLGNFISQQNTAARMIGGMLHYTLTKGSDGKITVSDVQFETLITHYVRGSADVKIYKRSQYSDRLAQNQAARIKCADFSLAYIDKYVSDVIAAEFLK